MKPRPIGFTRTRVDLRSSYVNNSVIETKVLVLEKSASATFNAFAGQLLKAGELSALGLLDDPAVTFAAKPSPGHESVMSGDSGFFMNSPTHSDTSYSDGFANTIYSDIIMKPDSNEADLIDYLTNGTESQEGEAEEVMGIMENQMVCFNEVNDDNVTSDNTLGADLSQLLSSVADRAPIDNTIDTTADLVKSTCSNTSRLRRSVRSRKSSGKTIVIASGIVTPAIPTTRSRVAAATSTSPTLGTSRSRPSLQSVSEGSDEFNLDDKCQNKNALQARVNRQKKKAYIEGLESQVSVLTTENEQLKRIQTRVEKDVASLQEEVTYLKSVIANDSALSGMIQNISNISGVRFTTSFEATRKRSASELDHDYLAGPSRSTTRAPKRRKATATATTSEAVVSGGICLHVDGDTVSVEFCAKCAKMAKGAAREEDV